MRLTLRTLLAYLDDTLDPSEIKHIGQKVAESDAAQELIARIKQITRRRRLTTPPLTGPGAKFDANTVAEYLDNELSTEQVAELEKVCLESDVHLAEIAASHQILTLVLGEPALVPPTAKERMYSLVQGREAMPFRKAPAAQQSTTPGSRPDLELEESPLLGLPFFRRPGWLRWALPVAGVLLLVGLGIALFMAIPTNPKPIAIADSSKTKDDKKDKDKDKDDKKDKDKDDKDKDDKKDKDKDDKKDKDKDDKKDKVDTIDKDKDDKKDGKIIPISPPPPMQRVIGKRVPPLTGTESIGTYETPGRRASVLLVRPAGPTEAPFKRAVEGAPVVTNTILLAPPGYAAEARTKTGVAVELRGNLPDFALHPVLALLHETEVMLHPSPEGVDLDLTLDRGRIFLRNVKPSGDAVVRLRCLNEIWDITLKGKDAEVGIDFIKKYTSDVNYLTGEEPRAEISLAALEGKVEVKGKEKNSPDKAILEPIPGAALLRWDNIGDPPLVPQVPRPDVHPIWGVIWGQQSPVSFLKKQMKELEGELEKAKPEQFKQIKAYIDFLELRRKRIEDLQIALDELATQINDKKPIALALDEARTDKSEYRRVLGIYALNAIGDVEALLNTLGDESVERASERDLAIICLRRHLSRGSEFGKALYSEDRGTASGLLATKYGGRDARKIYELFHDFPEKDRTKTTWETLIRYLHSDKLPVRQLAYWQLVQLAEGVQLQPFNAAAPLEQRKPIVDGLDKAVADGLLPPRKP